MDIDIGAIIKKVSRDKNVGPTELGTRIETSKQNIYGIFQRKSMDSALLMKLSIALDYDFFKFYVEELAKYWDEKAPGGELNGFSQASEMVSLRGEIKHLVNEIDLLREVNILLKEKLNICQNERVKH